MSGRKNFFVTLGFVISVSLVTAAAAVMMTAYHYDRMRFDLLNAVCGEVVEQEPETRGVIAAALKEYTTGNPDGVSETDVLSALGYRISDFQGLDYGQNGVFVMTGFLTGVLLFLFTFGYRNRKEAARIRTLAEYLEQVNIGKAVILSTSGEDDFSKLEDEIYKTVTFLYQTKEAAVQVKNDFAENLSNIAHQIKTPITSISLSVQMMKQAGENHSACGHDFCPVDQSVPVRDLYEAMPVAGREAAMKADCIRRDYLRKIEKQLLRLTHLEEALLVLSRIDSGTLPLQKKEADVFTLLVLAADNLQELFTGSGASIDIPESGEMTIIADPDWTMEAFMNLMKNCMEHGNGGTVHCSYVQTLLYTEILIWDEGEGFVKEDIPRLFERFYRGQNASEGGIGIGLALSKEIIERQNGTIRAGNKPGGGAFFEIRFYSH